METTIPRELATDTCPLCKAKNACAVDEKNGCWCMNSSVPAELLITLPAELRGVACICASCIARYHAEHKR